ncbi:MAG: DUF1540 domain-containing protein [Cellulosilyticum sp.]|nr:DUF1540 domain-containing protein [Cellulosilyticum sp.]
MPKINCSVENCSYNQGKYCCASIINVEGKGANITETTCCATFLDRMGYSNLQVDAACHSNELDAILCKVDTCVYNKDRHCSLQEIEVGALTKPEVYTQTDCLSFDRKSY